MRKIALLLAVLVTAVNAASNVLQSSNPSTTTRKSSTHAPDNHQMTCPGHGHQPGGAAVDINAVNRKPISLYGTDPDVTKAVNDIQAAANQSGPGGPGVAA